MRGIRHWTPRYIGNRLRVLAHERFHPDFPWLTANMVSILNTWLKSEDVGFEWGSGRSTIWFAQRVESLTSVEHNEAWYSEIAHRMEKHGVRNVNYQLRTDETDYVSVVENVPVASLDFSLVDGLNRDRCAIAVLPKLKPGGILIVDNCNWYLPSNSKSPNSRAFRDGRASGGWDLFIDRTSDWRSIWTTNGVTDTALWVKPISIERANERCR